MLTLVLAVGLYLAQLLALHFTWNQLAQLFDVPTITYLQTVYMLCVSAILFGRSK